MRKSLYLSLLVGLIVVFAQSVFAAETTTERTVKQTGKPAVESVITTSETVQFVSVNQARRIVKLKTSDGEVATYQVGKEVRNLAQVKEGDVLKAKEVERLAVYSWKGREKLAFTQSLTLKRAPKGAKPGFIATETTKITGRVQLVLYGKRRVVITGPRGRSMSFDIAPDVRNLGQLKPGDLVAVEYTDSLAIYVETPKK